MIGNVTVRQGAVGFLEVTSLDWSFGLMKPTSSNCWVRSASFDSSYTFYFVKPFETIKIRLIDSKKFHFIKRWLVALLGRIV